MDEVNIHETRVFSKAQKYYNQHTRHLPDIRIGSSVALQLPHTKMWDIYGTVVDIGPHRHYFVKTQEWLHSNL